MNDNILNVLCCCPLFYKVKKTVIEEFMQTSDFIIKKFKKNEIVFSTDQNSDNMGIVISGCAEVQKYLPSGNIVCLDQKKKGQTFGGAVIFSSNSTYDYDVTAKNDCEILFLSRQSIKQFMDENPMIASNVLNTFSTHMMYYGKKVELFSYSSIKKKIAFYLLDKMETDKSNIITLPFSKKTWSEYLNVSRPSLYRELKKLCIEHILTVKGNKITVLKPDELQSIL